LKSVNRAGNVPAYRGERLVAPAHQWKSPSLFQTRGAKDHLGSRTRSKNLKLGLRCESRGMQASASRDGFPGSKIRLATTRPSGQVNLQQRNPQPFRYPKQQCAGSNDPEPALIQPLSYKPCERGRVGIVIANWFRPSLFEERIEVLQPLIFCNRTLLSRGRSFYANLQAGPQQYKVEGHLFQDLASSVYVGRRY